MNHLEFLSQKIVNLLEQTPGIELSVIEINDELNRPDTKGQRSTVSQCCKQLFVVGRIARSYCRDTEGNRLRYKYSVLESKETP